MRIVRRATRHARGFSLAIIAGSVALLGLVPAAQADLRVGQNYRLSSDSNPFRGKDQVALAVDPANPKHIVATHANYLTEDCEGTRSVDGGVTWSEAFALQPPPAGGGEPFLPSCRISNHLGESMFQTVAFGSGANVYAVSITPRQAVFGEAAAGVIVYKSTNGGLTWANGVEAMPGGPSTATGPTVATGPYYELPTIAVDPGAGPGGADRVYTVARDTVGVGNNVPPCAATCASIKAAVSNDGGQTFGAPVQTSPTGIAIAGPDSASQPVINPDGSVSVAWRTLGTAGDIQIARSTDAGQTWGAAVTVTGVTAGGRPSTSHVTSLPSTGSSFPRLAGDKENGNLYIVYNQGPPGPTAPPGGYLGADHFINPDSHVYFQRSLDSGATWSTPKLIGDVTAYPGSLTVQTRHPSVSVAPNGRVDIVWEDRRHWFQGPGERNCVHTHLACDDARLGDTYYASSTNGGQTFSADRRISDRSHNNDVGYDYRFGVGWAFGPQAVSISNDELLVGWMDSREGDSDTDTQDIYLAKVRRGAPATVPQTKIDQPNAVALSVALSQRTYPGGGESVLASTFATRPATSVVIANQGDVPGALAAGVLARANLGPVLLSPAGGLPASVKTEVSRLSPVGAYVIGDTGKLSAQVVADLAAAGVDPTKIERLSGAGDAGTAAAIAAEFDRRTPAEVAAPIPAFDAAVIANPAGPDAVAAAALAAARRLPILYVSAGATPAATATALTTLNINDTLVVGGAGQVSNTVMNALPSPERIGGADRYATSKAVAGESMDRGLPSNIVYVADGSRPMDAALLGAAVGRATGIMVLSPASVSATAPGTAAAADLTGIDRLIVVEPTAPPAVAVPKPPAVTPAPASCGQLKLVKRNASKSRTRVVTRVKLPCAGKLTARATAKVRVKGKLRNVRQKSTIKKGSGLNRSIRVTLSKSARRTLRQTGKVRIRIRATFVPDVLSATSKKSSRTITVTVRRKK
ncbi:MAG: cell wall-binding repeat-containing protein [Solirubrobacteraceae bacterium]